MVVVQTSAMLNLLAYPAQAAFETRFASINGLNGLRLDMYLRHQRYIIAQHVANFVNFQDERRSSFLTRSGLLTKNSYFGLIRLRQ